MLVTTVECLIYSMSCHQDQLEVHEKMKETTKQLEELIPLMRSYLALPEPDHPLSRVRSLLLALWVGPRPALPLQQRWWMHRARINREVEVILHNFHLLHVVLAAAEYSVSHLCPYPLSQPFLTPPYDHRRFLIQRSDRSSKRK